MQVACPGTSSAIAIATSASQVTTAIALGFGGAVNSTTSSLSLLKREPGELREVIVVSDNYHKSIYDFVDKMYDDDMVRNAGQMLVDLASVLFKNSKLGKRILAKIPKIPQLPAPEEVMKKLAERLAGKDVVDAFEKIYENYDDPVGLLMEGLSYFLPNIKMAYDYIIKGIFLKTLGHMDNLLIWRMIDESWNVEGRFNAGDYDALKNGGDKLGFITVTRAQLGNIMYEQFFFPEDYPSQKITKFNIEHYTNTIFGGDEPMFYIYFNRSADKGFLHFSEVGVMPVFPKPKKKKP